MITNEFVHHVALNLFDCGAFKDKTHPTAIEDHGQRGFLLKLHEKEPDAPLSPFYFNLRTGDNPNPGPLTPQHIKDCAALMQSVAEAYGLTYEHVCGLPHAGQPLAEAYCALDHQAMRRTGILTLAKYQCGEKRRIIGPPSGSFQPHDRVLVIDDLITAADSKLEAIGELEKAGLVVKNVLVMVDRQQGGGKELRQRGYRLYRCFTIDGLIGIYKLHYRLSSELCSEIIAYLRSLE